MKFSSALSRFGSLTLASWLLASSAALAFKPSNVSTRPNYRRSGGTRDPIPGCIANPEAGQSLTALVPETTSLTTAAYPDLQWFLPENSASYLEFKLYQITSDEDLMPVYQVAHALSGEGGIATLSIPQNLGIAPLQMGTTYYWSVEVYCEVGNEQADMSVFGYVERVEANTALQAQMDAARTAVEQAEIAAEIGLWHDAATLLTSNLDSPSALAAWQDLLGAVELDDVAEEPLL